MPAAPPTSSDLAGYRQQADRFLAEMMEEYYLHLAGHKEALEIEPIYERYAELTTLEAAQSLGAAVDGDRGVRELWRFACDGFLGKLTTRQEERAGELSATLEVEVDGEKVGFRMLRPTIANEPDREKRHKLELARCDVADENLNPIYLEAAQIMRQAVPELGSENYYDLYLRFGFRLEELAAQCRAYLASTERMFEDAADRLMRARVGVSLAEAERWDTPRLLRAPEWDEHFPSDRMLPALETSLVDLGVDLSAQSNVELDVEQREKKSPRAFCAAIEIPDRVLLVIQPKGGLDDWRALFHEAGHAEHFANTARELEVEEKRLGDRAVTEGWAFLVEHMVDDPTWLRRRLDLGDPGALAADSAVSLLWLSRRYAAKLLYELELHQAPDVTAMKSRYVELLGDALKVSPSETDWLADVDGGFYATEYLRAWAFEAQMRFHLRERFGNDWFTKPEAGSLLRELWSLGQKPTADEILRELTGAEIELEAVAERAREALDSSVSV
jgi:hypothetical protein